MGGKGDDNSSNQDDMNSMMAAQQQNQQREAAALKQKAAATEPVTAKKTEEKPVTEAVVQPTEQTPMGDNLTGLGDQLVSGLSPGRVQQVADQTERLKADPQTYANQFDPYTGTYTGQGPYTTGGQV